MSYQLTIGSKEPLLFGEAPFWDAGSNKLLLVDCFEKSIVKFDPKTKEMQKKLVYHSKEIKYIMVAIPFAKDSNKFLTAGGGDQKLSEFDWETGEVTKVRFDFKSENVDPSYPLYWEDGKCDANGRLWIGTAEFTDLGILGVQKGKGKLNRFSRKPDSSELERYEAYSEFDVPNGLGWNRQNDKLFYNDLTKREIISFDFDLKSGTLKNRQIFFDFKNYPELDEGYPDGLVVDGNGHVWVACWKGGSVIKIDGVAGKVLDKINLPVTNVTSVCFGGKDYKTLFVTTTSIELDESRVIGQPDAGKIFQITSLNDNSFGGFQHYFLDVNL